MANQLVKINGRNLYDGLVTEVGGVTHNCNFETLTVSGRGLAPTRDRQLQFPGDVGARDYGSLPDVRRITVNGILHADTIQAFEYGMDQLKQLGRNRLKVDEILYGEVEAQTLWFADESIVAGPFVYSHEGTDGSGDYYIVNSASPIASYDQWGPKWTALGSTAADISTYDYKIEFTNSANDYYNGFLFDFWKIGSNSNQRQLYIKPTANFTSAPTAGDIFWVRDDRYYLVNYSGTMNEERLTRQWFAHGFANITLPFKAVYPFAVSEVKTTEFTPNATNGYFKSINTGTAPTFPVYRIKGAANTPTIVEATHSLVWNANDNNATNILGDTVGATVSAAGFYGQTGKLNQAIAFDSNQDKTKGDALTVTNPETRNGMGIGAALNANQATISFWAKKAGDWSLDLGGVTNEYLFANGNLYITIDHPTDRLYFQRGGVNNYVSTTTLTGGNWYLVVGRWDSRRAGWSTAYASAYISFEIYDTSGSLILNSNASSNPNDPDTAYDITLGSSLGSIQYWDGLIDDLAIWDRPLSDTEVSTLVNSGTGVRADTVASSELVYYSDFDQTVGTVFDDEQIASSNMDTAQVSATTTTTATIAGYGDKIFPGTDRFVLYDETGYKVQSTVATSADTSITYATLTDADKVGVYATLNGSQGFSQGDILNAGTSDLATSCWFNIPEGTADGNYFVIYKRDGGMLYNCAITILAGGTQALLNSSYYTDWSNYLYRYSTNMISAIDGKWHHAFFVWDNSTQTVQFYLDGTDISGSGSSVAGTVTTVSPSANIYVGIDYTGSANFWAANGKIKDLRVWAGNDLGAASLHAAAALTLASNPNGASVSINSHAEDAWWLMSDAATDTTLADSSASSNTLALVGGVDTNYGTHSRTQLAYISRNLIADGGMENGGIGGRLQGDAASSYSTITSQVKKDAQSIQITNGDATPAAFRNVFTTASGEDYVIRAWHRGAATIAFVNMMTVGATAIINTTQAGVTANTWGFVESCYEAAGASTDLSIISSSTTDTETCQYDDLKILPNLVDNGGMEGGAGPPTGWTQEAGATVTSDTDEHSGTNSLLITATGGDQGANQSLSGAFVAGNWYELSLWYKKGTATGKVMINDGAANVVSATDLTETSYTRRSWIFKAGGTGAGIYIRAVSAGTVYFDDIAIVHRPDLSASFNNMTNGYRFEPTRLTRGYKTGYNEKYDFSGQTINLDDYSIRTVFRPQYPSAVAEDSYIINVYSDGNDYIAVKYDNASDKFVFHRKAGGVHYYAYSPVMNFSQDDEIEIGCSFDTAAGMKIYVNGSNAGATNQASTTTASYIPAAASVLIGTYSTTSGNYPPVLIDDLEILAKSQPDEWFAEQHAKRNAAKFENLKAVYASTLDAGDILTLDSNTTKVIARAKLWDASASTDTDALTNMTINQSKMPILSPTKSMLYFPNSIPSGVEIYYRNNFQ